MRERDRVKENERERERKKEREREREREVERESQRERDSEREREREGDRERERCTHKQRDRHMGERCIVVVCCILSCLVAAIQRAPKLGSGKTGLAISPSMGCQWATVCKSHMQAYR